MRIEQNKLWENFYAGDSQVFYPSKFAESVLPLLERGGQLLDVGCGNGRDSVYFAQNGVDVTAIDLSQKAIAGLKSRAPCIRAVCDNVLTSSVFAEDAFDYIYSRFFIHALTESEQSQLLEHCLHSLRSGGLLLIETRCVEDELCGVGERISKTEWAVDGHYRRFIVPEELEAQLDGLGFKHIRTLKSKGFAPLHTADPVILRIFAEK